MPIIGNSIAGIIFNDGAIEVVAAPPKAKPRIRLVASMGRAMIFLGATALVAPACGDDDGGTDGGAGESGIVDTGSPMVDAGLDAGGDVDSGPEPTDGGPVEEMMLFPPYGTPPEELSRLV